MTRIRQPRPSNDIVFQRALRHRFEQLERGAASLQPVPVTQDELLAWYDHYGEPQVLGMPMRVVHEEEPSQCAIAEGRDFSISGRPC
jgi:hypothetical protein